MIPHPNRDWLGQVSYETSKRRRLNKSEVKEYLERLGQASTANLSVLDELMKNIVALKYFRIMGVGGYRGTPGFHVQQPPPHEKVYVVLAVIPYTHVDGIRVRLQQRIPGRVDTNEALLRFQAEIKDAEGVESVIRYLKRLT